MVTLDQAGWNRGQVVMRPAPPVLSEVVDFLWIDERPRFSPASDGWRIVADDAPHVIYSRHDDGGHRLHIVGARTHYVDVDCSRRRLTVGARLRPGAIPALFDIPAFELTNRSVPAAALVRAPADAALSRLGPATADDTMTHVASFIAEVLVAGRTLDARARRLGAIGATEMCAVHDVARDLGVGERGLRSWSAAHFGLGLRRFLRIRRLHTALERRLRDPRETWSQIAAATGFADQPHLVRDCRSLLGESPGEFFVRAI